MFSAWSGQHSGSSTRKIGKLSQSATEPMGPKWPAVAGISTRRRRRARCGRAADEYAVLVADVMRSYVDDSGTVLDQATTELLLDPDFAVGFGVSNEQGGIAIGHDGANEGYRSEFVAVPHLGQGVVLLTNSDSGLDLTSAVIDEVGGQFGWPWTGWSTPLWMFLLGLGLMVGVVAVIVRHLRKRRKGDLPAKPPVA